VKNDVVANIATVARFSNLGALILLSIRLRRSRLIRPSEAEGEPDTEYENQDTIGVGGYFVNDGADLESCVYL
jgi:hypothetical protein